ncbi:tyrosine-type recombinase/integrase [Kitasatospora sp. RG8]|uniref:tyrosine-type recombinase/integrase n=1 Tax=Kitasatospora sp. RG8 TaxID=2820815 RepID=UPI001FD7C12D|nr:tyrosine-type recombinase/integrase [Kitasatospora sp. RG8]
MAGRSPPRSCGTRRTWDEVVVALDYEHLRRHDLRHTGPTWMTDAGAPLHVLRKTAGHGSLTTTHWYLNPRPALDRAGRRGTERAPQQTPPGAWSRSGPAGLPRPPPATCTLTLPRKRQKPRWPGLPSSQRGSDIAVGTTGFEPATP